MENGSRKIGLRVAAGFVLAVIIIVAVFASGIQLPSIEVPGIEVETGKLNILLKDAPVEVDELWIKMTGLEVHKVGEGEGQWISIDISDAIEEATEEIKSRLKNKVETYSMQKEMATIAIMMAENKPNFPQNIKTLSLTYDKKEMIDLLQLSRTDLSNKNYIEALEKAIKAGNIYSTIIKKYFEEHNKIASI